MDAVQYLKIETYICSNYSCVYCPLSSDNNFENLRCALFKEKYLEKAVKIIEDWGKEKGLIK